MVQALDAGPVYMRDPLTISADATHGELYDFCAHRGADLLVSLLENPLPSPVPQPTEGITKAPKITPDLRTLNWHSSATELHNRMRAFSPTPGAIAHFRGPPVKIISTAVIEQNAPHSTAGSILKADKTGLWVACQTGTLNLLTLQPAGKKPMPVADFINGFQPKVGEVFDKKMDTL
jgi:methionyl-tRNA formyltransferase